jgi:amino acid transporter
MVTLNTVRASIIGSFSELPILGGLVECEWADHWHALGQFATELVFATCPIWLGALILYLTGVMTYLSALSEVTRGGELFVYCTATLGPVIFLVHKDPKGRGKFPGQMSHTVLAFVICAACSCMFGLLRAKVGLNPSRWFVVSMLLYSLTMVLYYLAIVYDVMLSVDPPNTLKAEEDAFAKKLEERVGSE